VRSKGLCRDSNAINSKAFWKQTYIFSELVKSTLIGRCWTIETRRPLPYLDFGWVRFNKFLQLELKRLKCLALMVLSVSTYLLRRFTLINIHLLRTRVYLQPNLSKEWTLSFIKSTPRVDAEWKCPCKNENRTKKNIYQEKMFERSSERAWRRIKINDIQKLKWIQFFIG